MLYIYFYFLIHGFLMIYFSFMCKCNEYKWNEQKMIRIKLNDTYNFYFKFQWNQHRNRFKNNDVFITLICAIFNLKFRYLLTFFEPWPNNFFVKVLQSNLIIKKKKVCWKWTSKSWCDMYNTMQIFFHYINYYDLIKIFYHFNQIEVERCYF